MAVSPKSQGDLCRGQPLLHVVTLGDLCSHGGGDFLQRVQMLKVILQELRDPRCVFGVRQTFDHAITGGNADQLPLFLALGAIIISIRRQTPFGRRLIQRAAFVLVPFQGSFGFMLWCRCVFLLFDLSAAVRAGLVQIGFLAQRLGTFADREFRPSVQRGTAV